MRQMLIVVLCFTYCKIFAQSGIVENACQVNGINYCGVHRIENDDNVKEKFSYANAIYIIESNLDLNGAEIKIPSGSLVKFHSVNIINGKLKIGDNTILEGDNNSFIYNSVSKNGDIELLRIEGNNVKIIGLNFLGNIHYNHPLADGENLHICVQCSYSQNVTIEKCSFSNTNACIGFDTCKDIKVSNCRFSNSYENKYTGVYGYGVVLNQVQHASVTNNVFLAIERHSIYISTHGLQSKDSQNAKNTENVVIKNNYIKSLDVSKIVDPRIPTGFEMPIKTIGGNNILFTANTIIGGRSAFLLTVDHINGGSIAIENNIHMEGRAFISMFNEPQCKQACSIGKLLVKGNKVELDCKDGYFGIFAGIRDSCVIQNNIVFNKCLGSTAITFRMEADWKNMTQSGLVFIVDNIFDNFSGGFWINNVDQLYSYNYFTFPPHSVGEWRGVEESENVRFSEYFIHPIIDYYDFQNQSGRYNKNIIYYDRKDRCYMKCHDYSKNIWKKYR